MDKETEARGESMSRVSMAVGEGEEVVLTATQILTWTIERERETRSTPKRE